MNIPTIRARRPCPLLYQLNTRVYLTDLAASLGRRAGLDDIPDSKLDQLAELGFGWVWLLSVWRTGPAGQRISRMNPAWRLEFEATLPDLREEDIGGSGFAIYDYTVHPDLGGAQALGRLRDRLRSRGLRLMLDFVPNHTATDHPWVEDHPEFYIAGTAENLAQTPSNYGRIERSEGDQVLAYGRDPYFSGWPDTFQLDYSNPDTQDAMIGELQRIATRCDGVRCDMAMLLLPDVFEQTWGRHMEQFWPRAIAEVRGGAPDFRFMAEVYWDREWALLQLGFDYVYDKRLYDRLRAGQARPVREHLQAGIDYQTKLVRFLENHDEQRAAVTFPPETHQAAAVITYLSPGLRFFHHGQFAGHKLRVSPHLVRAPIEQTDPALSRFYQDLLATLRSEFLLDAEWRLLDCLPAWDTNWTWDCFIAWCWQAGNDRRTLVAVNYAGNQSQCYVPLPWPDLAGRPIQLQDLFFPRCFVRDGSELISTGLYLDLPPWGRHVFAVSALS